MRDERFDHLAEREDVSTIFIHETARAQIQQQLSQLDRLRAIFGTDSLEYLHEAASLARCYANILRTGMDRRQYVTAMHDGAPTDLLVQTEHGFVFGVNRHRAPVVSESRQVLGDVPAEFLPGIWSCNS